MKLKKTFISSPLAFICNIALAYLMYGLCRMVYLAENWSVLSEGFDSLSLWEAFKGCWMFDTSAILYTNALYAVLMLLPLHIKEKEWWQQTAKWLFVLVNTICIVANMADAVYFQYSGRRTTSSVFEQFSNENNIGGVVEVELLSHWYLVLATLLMIAGMVILYVKPHGQLKVKMLKDRLLYYAVQILCFGLYIPITICGMRGGATTAVRPITISNANQYVNRPAEAALVLNTPFSLIRTINKRAFTDPKYYSQKELDSLYSPFHTPADSIQPTRRNVVVLIMESYGREYISALNDNTDIKDYKGYTPFTDSLVSQSLTFDLTLCNGRQSIDGMPAILSSIPRFLEPFFLTPASMNKVSGIAGELRKVGYQTAFFHGAENGSMGFEAFAKATGYAKYYGRTEYNKDSRFNGDKDFDGMWAIWDEEFMQFYALQMNEMQQPFATTIFTASSHHPYNVPDRYKDVYRDEPGDDNIMHKCIRYVDHSLRRFFETAKQQPSYDNTIFVITADHTNLSSYPESPTDLGSFCVPIIIFDPQQQIQPQRRHGIAQQIDIMPTVLNYVGYDRPYVAFGKDLLSTPDSATWAVNYTNGIYQYVKGDLILQMTEDGQVSGLYDYKRDWLMKNNLKGQRPEQQSMKRQLKAIIQSYMQRMVNDQLTADGNKSSAK